MYFVVNCKPLPDQSWLFSRFAAAVRPINNSFQEVNLYTLFPPAMGSRWLRENGAMAVSSQSYSAKYRCRGVASRCRSAISIRTECFPGTVAWRATPSFLLLLAVRNRQLLEEHNDCSPENFTGPSIGLLLVFYRSIGPSTGPRSVLLSLLEYPWSFDVNRNRRFAWLPNDLLILVFRFAVYPGLSADSGRDRAFRALSGAR